MKRRIALILCAGLLLALCGCAVGYSSGYYHDYPYYYSSPYYYGSPYYYSRPYYRHYYYNDYYYPYGGSYYFRYRSR